MGTKERIEPSTAGKSKTKRTVAKSGESIVTPVIVTQPR